MKGMTALKKILFPLIIMLLSMLLIPEVTSAKSIFEHQNTTIPSGQTVNDVYVVGGDAEVQGHVTGIVVVINGNLHLTSTSNVEGLVLVVGGTVQQDSGAIVEDDVYDISLDNETQNSLLIGGGLILGIWVLQLAGSLLMILIPVLIRVVGKQKSAAFIDRHQPESMGRLLYTGLLSGLILAAISVLLMVTVIGIPLLIIVVIALVLAFAMGMTVVSYRLGERFQWAQHRSDWLKTLAGAAIIAAFANIPFLGWIVLVVVMILSLGICTQWIAGKRKRKP